MTMILIDNDQKALIGVTQTSYLLDLDGGLSDRLRALLRHELLAILKSKGITDVNKLDVSISAHIMAVTKE
ncbi:hypothetical protein GQ472_01860 [archaeon]|nr:hypothetical protein [archaeon]